MTKSQMTFLFTSAPLVANRASKSIHISFGFTANFVASESLGSGRPARSAPVCHIRSIVSEKMNSLSDDSRGSGAGRTKSVKDVGSSSSISGSGPSICLNCQDMYEAGDRRKEELTNKSSSSSSMSNGFKISSSSSSLTTLLIPSAAANSG